MYSTDNRLAGTQQSLTTSFKTLLALTAATASLRRAAICEIHVGADGAPNATDCQIVWDVSRQTAAGTSTSATPVALNPADAASDTVATVNFTAEGTITAASSIWRRSLNQRNSVQWAALDKDAELIIPATNLSGLAVRALSPTYAAAALAHVIHRDL